MSITVADCLKLPSLREAEVLGGRKGLNKTVAFVTVMEYADLSALESEHFYMGNEMIISAFVSIKDDVEAQSKLIRHFHDMGEAGLVLYYVGIYLPSVDAKLIQLADELYFPLIIMPPNRYEHRYSDVISEVMNAIINDRRQETSIVSGILDQVAQLKPSGRNIGTIMRMLSDRLQCTLLLADRNGNKRAFASWPLGANWNENDLSTIIKLRRSKTQFDEPIELNINGRVVQVHCMTLDTKKQKGLMLLGIDESKNINHSNLSQAIEALQLFSNIWNNDFTSEGTDAIVRAILNNQPGDMKRIARQLCVDVDALNTMWILWEKGKNSIYAKNNNEWMAARLASFLKEETNNTVLIDVVVDYVVAFLGASHTSNMENELEKQFMDVGDDLKSNWILFNSLRLPSTGEARAAFLLMEENIEAACSIYPLQNILTRFELLFAQKCRRILEDGEEEIKKITRILEPLMQDEAGRETIETLSVLLLDCQCSIVETSNQLYIHKNTVKYRIKKARSIIGFDVMKMPEMTDLYEALALQRLLP